MQTTPEQQAREHIDQLLQAAGWRVQDRDEASIHASRGVAIREFPLKSGHGFADFPRYATEKAKAKRISSPCRLQIELTDFSVYYSQGAAEEAIKAMKNGKNGVICEQGQLVKISKSKDGVISRETLTQHWTDWVDYWAVDFDYMSRPEIIRAPVGTGVDGVLPGFEHGQQHMPLEFEERKTGSYIFENEWQSFRTRKKRDLELTTAEHTYDRPGRYTIAVKVVDIFGNDTMTLVPVTVG